MMCLQYRYCQTPEMDVKERIQMPPETCEQICIAFRWGIRVNDHLATCTNRTQKMRGVCAIRGKKKLQ